MFSQNYSNVLTQAEILQNNDNYLKDFKQKSGSDQLIVRGKDDVDSQDLAQDFIRWVASSEIAINNVPVDNTITSAEQVKALLIKEFGEKAEWILRFYAQDLAFFINVAANNSKFKERYHLQQNMLSQPPHTYEFFKNNDKVYFRFIQKPLIICRDTGEQIGTLPGDTEILYEITENGYELEAVATNNKIIRDMILAREFHVSDKDYIEDFNPIVVATKPVVTTEQLEEKTDNPFIEADSDAEDEDILAPTGEDKRILATYNNTSTNNAPTLAPQRTIFDEIFDVKLAPAERRFNPLAIFGLRLSNDTGERIKSFLGFPRKPNVWNFIEYFPIGMIINPIKNLLKLIIQYPIQVMDKWLADEWKYLTSNRSFLKAFLNKPVAVTVVGLFYALIWPVNKLVQCFMSPIASAKAAWKVNPALGVLSALVSISLYVGLAILATPIVAPAYIKAGVSSISQWSGLSKVASGIAVVFSEAAAMAATVTLFLATVALSARTLFKTIGAYASDKCINQNQLVVGLSPRPSSVNSIANALKIKINAVTTKSSSSSNDNNSGPANAVANIVKPQPLQPSKTQLLPIDSDDENFENNSTKFNEPSQSGVFHRV
jgi:hypothetical protein